MPKSNIRLIVKYLPRCTISYSRVAPRKRLNEGRGQKSLITGYVSQTRPILLSKDHHLPQYSKASLLSFTVVIFGRSFRLPYTLCMVPDTIYALRW